MWPLDPFVADSVRVDARCTVSHARCGCTAALGRLLSEPGVVSGLPVGRKKAVDRMINYWIASSARTRIACGTVIASAFAVLRLITSSNLVVCSTGRSAGLLPFRILSTYFDALR